MRGVGKLAKAVSIFGGISVVVYVVAFGLTPTHAPDSASSGARIAQYVSSHRTTLLVSDLLIALALALIVIFAASLYRMMRRAEHQDGWLAIAALASIVTGAGIFGVGTALFMVVHYRPTADPALLRGLTDGGWIAYNSSGFAFGAWIAIVAAAALSHRFLPAWTAWIGIPIALINLVGPLALKMGTGAFSPQGAWALVVGVTFPIWVIAISIATWQSARAPAETA